MEMESSQMFDALYHAMLFIDSSQEILLFSRSLSGRWLIIFLFILFPQSPLSQHSLLHPNISFIVADSVVSFKTGAQYHAF